MSAGRCYFSKTASPVGGWHAAMAAANGSPIHTYGMRYVRLCFDGLMDWLGLCHGQGNFPHPGRGFPLHLWPVGECQKLPVDQC